jgi:hypothetical protein
LIAHGDGTGFHAVRVLQTCSKVRWINHALWKPQLKHRTWKAVVICRVFSFILLVDSPHWLSVGKVPSTCTSRTSQRVNTLWSCGTSQRQNRRKCVLCQSNLIFGYNYYTFYWISLPRMEVLALLPCFVLCFAGRSLVRQV